MTAYSYVESEARKHVQEIAQNLISSNEYVRDILAGAMRIVEKSFMRRGNFLLEFIQNAEDVGATRVKVLLRNNNLEIYNDGRPFSREDVEAICSIGRSSKDPREFFGYLGIGFKTVFLISSSPHIISHPYRFKFDKNHWPDPRKIPWQITPIWLDQVPEAIASEAKSWNTSFLIPVNELWLDTVKKEFERFDSHLLLFLRNLRKVELVWDNKIKKISKIVDQKEAFEICRLETSVNNKVETSLWVIFRKLVKVPEDVRKDPVTEEWERSGVERREIAVAFLLNEEGDLSPLRQGSVKYGVFSYLPLHEEVYEIPFIIHSDFLTGPGRENMHREARWNLWLLEEILEFIRRNIIPSLKSHNKWRFSYTEVLYGNAAHIIETKLMQPLRNELEKGKHIVDIRGNFIDKYSAIKVTKNVLDLLEVDLIEKLTKKKIIHPDSKLAQNIVKEIEEIKSVRDFAEKYFTPEQVKSASKEERVTYYRKFLEALAKEFFSLQENTRRSYKNKYRICTWVLDELEQEHSVQSIYEGISEKIYIASGDLKEKARKYFPREFRFLHPDLQNEFIVKYLLEIGMPELKEEEIIKKSREKKIPELVRVLQDSSSSDEEKIEALKELKKMWEERIIKDSELAKFENEIKVPTKSGKWLAPREVLLSIEYEPDEKIEDLIQRGLLDWEEEFLSPVFVHSASRDELAEWRKFFKMLGVGKNFEEKKKHAIQRIAILVARRYETEKCRVPENEVRELTSSEAQGKGYDIESKMSDGSTKYIEVKGSSESEPEIAFTRNEFQLIIHKPDHSFIYITTDALKKPKLSVISGKKLMEGFIRLVFSYSKLKGKVEDVWEPY